MEFDVVIVGAGPAGSFFPLRNLVQANSNYDCFSHRKVCQARSASSSSQSNAAKRSACVWLKRALKSAAIFCREMCLNRER